MPTSMQLCTGCVLMGVAVSFALKGCGKPWTAEEFQLRLFLSITVQNLPHNEKEVLTIKLLIGSTVIIL